MYSVGQRLREERLRKGLKLRDVAEKTRIRVAFLEAIEADQFHALPGSFFARSFVRQYADLLEIMDPELEAEILRQLGEAGVTDSAGQVLAELAAAQRAPVLSRGRPAAPAMAYAATGFLVVAAVLGLYFGWQQVRGGAGADRQASVSAPGSVSLPEQVTNPSPPPAALPSEEAKSVTALSGSFPSEAAAPEPESPLVVEVSAVRPSWIQVTADGQVVFSNTLQAGQSRKFRAAQTIRILTGNAGALEVRRNGHSIGPVGPEGHIRTLDLTPEGHAVTAPAPKPPTPQPDTQA